jgi:hypothetical protein
MILNDCMEAVTKAAGRELSKAEIKELSAELEKRTRAAQAEVTGRSYEEAALKAADELGQHLKAAAAIERRNAALNLKRLNEAVTFIKNSFADNPALGLRTILTGSQRLRVGARRSVAAEQEQLRGHYLGGLLADLERSGHLSLLASGAADLDIATALWALNQETPNVDGILPQAVELARVIQKWQEIARVDANKAGAWIGKLPGYIVRQSHDMWKIRSAGFEAWRDAILPDLDLTRMQVEAADVDGYLREVFTGLATGQHLKAGPSEKAGAFTGPANLAKKLSQERSLHFRDAAAWHRYNERFGTGNLREALFSGLMRSADSTGLMRTMGTNPGALFDRIADGIAKSLRADTEKLTAFANEIGTPNAPGSVRERLMQVDGTLRIPVNQMLARASSSIRAVETMAKLGGSVLSSVSDLPVYASEMRYQGRGFLSGLGEAIAGVAKGRPTGEQREILSSLGVVFDSMIGDITRWGSHDDSTPGRLARMTQTFFKLNLQSWWTDSLLSSAALSMSHDLGQHLGKSFDELRPELTRVLGLYGITKAEWDSLTHVEGRTAQDGRVYLTPEHARLADDAEVDKVIAGEISRIKQDAADFIAKVDAQNAREAEWVTGRAQKLQATLERARTSLASRIEKLDSKTAERVGELRERISKLEETLEETAETWRTPADPDTPGISGRQRVSFYGKQYLRSLGVREGRARTKATEIAGDVRAITREAQGLKEELGESFVESWRAKEEEFIAFADGVRERSKLRSETAKEYAGKVGDRINRARTAYREQLESKLRTFFVDRARIAVLHPDAETRAIMQQGTRAGTAFGEAARFIGQFKSFSVSYLQRILGREIYGRGSDSLGQAMRNGNGEVLGLAMTLLWTTAFGYAAMVAKDSLKGRTPRDPLHYKTWFAAMTQGGGLGIYGDFLFGESNRFGGGLWSTVLGPTASTANDVYDLYQRVKAGDDPSAQALRIALSNTPFMNLFYTRTALDYLVLYQIQEALNPGYLSRLEERVERENAQTFWLRPTEAAR